MINKSFHKIDITILLNLASRINLNEIRKDRFNRVAEKRTNVILKKLQIFGNCANRQNYRYERDDVDKIFRAIEKKLKEIKSKFYYPEENEFRL